MCSLRVIEGLIFLVEFENEESFQSFFEMYGGQEDIHIADLEDETIKKKITIYKRVKDVPIFSSRNLKSKKGNCLSKHQLQSVLNFINFRPHDHDELLEHNTTTWFSYKRDWKIETFKLEFNKELEESQPNFTKLLPIKVIMRMSNLTYRCYDWLLNGAHVCPKKIHDTACSITKIHTTNEHKRLYVLHGKQQWRNCKHTCINNINKRELKPWKRHHSNKI